MKQGVGVLSTIKNLKGLRALMFASLVAVLILSAATVFLIIYEPKLWLMYIALIGFALALGFFNAWLPAFFAWRLHKRFPGEYSFDEKLDMFSSPSPHGVSDQFRWALARKRILSKVLVWILMIPAIILFIVLMYRGVFFPEGWNSDKSRRAEANYVVMAGLDPAIPVLATVKQ